MIALPRIDRARLFAGAALIGALNSFAPRISWALEKGDLRQAATDLFGVSAILWLALAAIAAIAMEDDGDPASARDWLLGGGVALLALLPAPLIAAALLVPLGLVIWRLDGAEGGGDRRLRRIAGIVLALSLTLFWGPLVLRLFPEILTIDAGLTARALGMKADGNLYWSLDGAQRYLIAPGCSSLANISLATIFMVTLASWLNLPLRRGLIGWTLLASLATVAVNVVRLSLFATRPDEFVYWHSGEGSVLFGWFNLIALGSVVLFAVARLQDREARALAA
jgi:exosortase/archaeosortase family protein